MEGNGVAMETLEEAAPRARAEIDTSAPFESVKEAVDKFGGSAHWKFQLKQLFPVSQTHHAAEDVDVIMVEQTAQLEKDLVVKEKENLNILKDLEMTKNIMDDLKLKLQKEAFQNPGALDMKIHPILETEDQLETPSKGSKQSPGSILMELKQAKLILNQTTSDLAGIKSSVELLASKIENEKALLEKTQEKLNTNTALVSSLAEELDQTTLKLQQTQNVDISEEIKRVSSEIEKFRKMKEDYKSEVLKLNLETEETKVCIKTAEIRFSVAKKMEEAAKAAVESLTKKNSLTEEIITLSIEEYNELTRKAKEAEDMSRKKITDAMDEVEQANESKHKLLKDVEKAETEVKTSRKLLEEALIRVEAANRGKLAVEEALRKWRSEQGQKKRYVHSSPKFKNSSHHYRRDSRNIDLNKPTLSIGQILSKKLMSPEDYDIRVEDNVNIIPKVSLGQILSKKHGVLSPQSSDNENVTARKNYSMKRKKFGLVGISLLKSKQSKKARNIEKAKERIND